MSYREVNAQVVKAACLAYIKEFEKTIDELSEPLIQQEMKGGWFKKEKTREEAINALTSDPFSDYYSIVKFHGNRNTRKIEQLLALCNVSSTYDSTIYLDGESAEILESFLKSPTILNG